MQLSRCHTSVLVRCTRPHALAVPSCARQAVGGTQQRVLLAHQAASSLPQPLSASCAPFLVASRGQFGAGAAPEQHRSPVSTAASAGSADAAAEPPAQPQGLFVKKVAGKQQLVTFHLVVIHAAALPGSPQQPTMVLRRSCH